MKVIVAPDSFKGSLTAIEAAEAMAAGICDVNPDIQTVLLPAADGGEGTMRSLVDATKGEYVSVSVEDPLGRPIRATYGILGDGETCAIEIAEASGLMRLQEHEKNPHIASSYGTGELIAHALDNGYRKFIIGLGGSATNDGGAGILQALGMRLLNREGNELPKGGGGLEHIYSIDSVKWDARIAESEFLIASDVKNPFVGSEGASAIFG
ncbi:MAG TPA: glycerate kinase, partial [Sporosarcina sp.]|nr:glycerate kinase [Sporosarcina sp.]